MFDQSHQKAADLPTARTDTRLLLAEDQYINQKVVHRLLKKLGYAVDVVANGFEVLEAFEKQDYDVVFMDVMMPGMSGIEATKHIRDKEGNIPYIIALTANAREADRRSCLQAGMQDFLAKPIDIKALSDALERYFQTIEP